MRLIKEEKFNQVLKQEFKYQFNISESGLYLIEINARAKSWWHNAVLLES